MERIHFRVITADLILVIHFAFVLFALFGAFLFLVNDLFILVHIPAVAWSSIINLANLTCPLTPLEQQLRRQGGQQSFEGGWIQHYFEPLVRPLGMPRTMQLIAGVSVVVWNVFVYAILVLLRA